MLLVVVGIVLAASLGLWLALEWRRPYIIRSEFEEFGLTMKRRK